MGQTPAKTFNPPVAFGDSQVNTLQKAQAPDLIRQQQLPSLNFANQAAASTGGGNSAAPAAPKASSQLGPIVNPAFMRFFRPYQ